ncbi:MAG: L,D-transpeptidase family protein [Candidatus Omnitrophota bacterium]|nr:L,D-transpeptidase family protein [Candidatus Omnitrophota bacterium]
MTKNRFILLIAVFVMILIILVSFIVLKKTPSGLEGIAGLDKAKLIYKRAERFRKADEHEKALNALLEVVNNYPDSKYAEKSLKLLASIYMRRGNYVKARYYYKRLLMDFPDLKDVSSIRSVLEEINMKEMFSPVITEDSIEYEIQPGDNLYVISKRFNTTVGFLKKLNRLQNDLIRPGQKLKIVVARFSILIDKARNKLVLKKDGEPLKTYTVSTGKDNSTPVGVFKIEEKMVRPVWYKVDAVISPDSEEYELGERWMGLSVRGYGIHGTVDESTIGNQITQGCVRMRNSDVIELYDIVPAGTEVEVVDALEPAAGPGKKGTVQEKADKAG